MNSTSILFQLDPMAASSYGLYQSLKENKGSFVDFLLSYDSKGANDGDNSWLTKMVNQNTLSKISSPEVYKALNFANIDPLSFISTSDYFDTKVEMYKLQISQEMAKRGITQPD